MDNPQKLPLTRAEIQAKLAGKKGKQYWRCLEEIAETPEFMEYLADEVPQQTRALATGMDRRQFLTLAGASLALAGVSGCRWLPDKKVVPYVSQPEDVTPGLPLTFATSVLRGGYAMGVLATSYEYRPTKLEGNPEHPASLGASDAYTQAELLNLYDPDRSQNVVRRLDPIPGDVDTGELSDWPQFFDAFDKQLSNLPATGEGLRILTGTVTSPTFNDQMTALLKKYSAAKWHQYEACGRTNVYKGASLAFGTPVNTLYHFDKADRILSLDADFLLTMQGSVRYAHDFAEKRRVRHGATEMNRLYAIESTPTITGAMADHPLPVKPSDVMLIAAEIAKQLGVELSGTADAPSTPLHAEWIPALVKDLLAHKGSSLVIAGDEQSPEVHSLAHKMNAVLGNVGNTVVYTDLVEFGVEDGDQIASLKTLVDDMKATKVKILVIIDTNPLYSAPADFDFFRAVNNVPLRVRLAQHDDETSQICHWHLPSTHTLEAWGDARAYDGTLSIMQPLVSPLYEGRSALELISAIQGNIVPGYDLVHNYWSRQGLPGDFEKTFQTYLHDGIVKDTALPIKAVSGPVTIKAGALSEGALAGHVNASQGLEIVFRPDQTIYDGTFSNNGWMQELPKQLTKLTWDNAALVSAQTASDLKLVPSNFLLESDQKDAKVIAIKVGGRTVNAPIQIIAGHPDNVITLNFGYGRTKGGQLGTGIGANAYALRTSTSLGYGLDATIQDTGLTYPLSHTRAHFNMEKRDIVMEATLEEWLKNPEFAKTESTEVPDPKETVYDPNDHKYEGFGAYKWAMSIDNSVCIGCQACVTACQAENNIPVVGKDQVSRGREMQWIRVDRYYSDSPYNSGNPSYDNPPSLANPRTFFEPVPCMQCENAPCEPVCPVAATVHSHEGLNQMIYNRCVGTKYCSDNCPYKVRRFNFYKYAAGQPNRGGTNYDLPVLKLSANPEVSIRGRGVMEKCTYCTQRISAARQTAKIEERELHDGEVVTACQQACPTNAIVFGNLNDKESAVYKLKQEPHGYTLLGELNTRPRTTYLAKLSNPNPEITPPQTTPPHGAGEE